MMKYQQQSYQVLRFEINYMSYRTIEYDIDKIDTYKPQQYEKESHDL